MSVTRTRDRGGRRGRTRSAAHELLELAKARLAMLEEALADERRARHELAASLRLERLRRDELEARLAERHQDRSTDRASLMRELESAWDELRALQMEHDRRPRRPWRRRA